MNDESIKASSDLIRWLKMLALPKWARIVLALVMLLVLSSSLGLLIWGLLNSKFEVISSAVAILTVGLPIGLIVLALVFGDGGAIKPKERTTLVLEKEIPEAILQNLTSTSTELGFNNPKLISTLRGCIADYVLSVDRGSVDASDNAKLISLEFKLELNVKKVNLVIWIPLLDNGEGQVWSNKLEHYQSCFFGATKEGYIQNTAPIRDSTGRCTGFIFIKTLNEDFLLNPGDRLYFAQDLAFFVRSLLNVALQND